MVRIADSRRAVFLEAGRVGHWLHRRADDVRNRLPGTPSLLVLLALFLVMSTVVAFGITLVAGGVLRRGPGHGGWVSQPTAKLGQPLGFWQRYVNEADGYSLALPPQWQVIPLDGETPAADDTGVQARLVARAQQYRDAGMGLWAAEAPGGTLGDATTVNIVRQPLGQDVTVTEFADTSLASLADSVQLTGEISKRSISLPSGQALETQAVFLPAGSDGQAKTLAMTQVYMVRGQNGYVVTCTARPEEATEYAPIIEGMVMSMRWLDAAPGAQPGELPWALLQQSPQADWS